MFALLAGILQNAEPLILYHIGVFCAIPQGETINRDSDDTEYFSFRFCTLISVVAEKSMKLVKLVK